MRPIPFATLGDVTEDEKTPGSTEQQHFITFPQKSRLSIAFLSKYSIYISNKTFHSIVGGGDWKRAASTGYKPDETGLAATVERTRWQNANFQLNICTLPGWRLVNPYLSSLSCAVVYPNFPLPAKQYRSLQMQPPRQDRLPSGHKEHKMLSKRNHVWDRSVVDSRKMKDHHQRALAW